MKIFSLSFILVAFLLSSNEFTDASGNHKKKRKIYKYRKLPQSGKRTESPDRKITNPEEKEIKNTLETKANNAYQCHITQGNPSRSNPPITKVKISYPNFSYLLDNAENKIEIEASPLSIFLKEADIFDDEHSTLFKKDLTVGSSRVDLQACKLEYSIVSPK